MTSSGVARTVLNLESLYDMPESLVAESFFAELRPRLFAIAYRRVGDVGEAEDIVQETWIRWQNCDRSTVRDPRAFLAATTARLSSNAAQSARARHETYIHTWLPEPADATADPVLAAERGDAIEFAVRLTLEKLSPSQRASYVLRHAFDYPYVRIAEIIQQTQASVRQHVSRARKRLAGRNRVAISVRKHRQLLDAFVAGAQDGNLVALEQVLAADVIKEGQRCGPTRTDANLIRNASARSLAALGPVTGVHEQRDRSQAKAGARSAHACQRSSPRRPGL